MNEENHETNLLNLIKAQTPIIQIVSYETQRIHGLLVRAARELERDLYAWWRVEGIRKWNKEKKCFEIDDKEKNDPHDVLEFFANSENKEIILWLEDFHTELDSSNPEIISTLRKITQKNEKGKTLVLSQDIQESLSQLSHF